MVVVVLSRKLVACLALDLWVGCMRWDWLVWCTRYSGCVRDRYVRVGSVIRDLVMPKK